MITERLEFLWERNLKNSCSGDEQKELLDLLAKVDMDDYLIEFLERTIHDSEMQNVIAEADSEKMWHKISHRISEIS